MLFCIGPVFGGNPQTGSKIKILREVDGFLPTSIKGTSTTKPPYVRILRSKEGLDYLINDFMRHKNRATHARVKSLRTSFSSVNFEKEMIVAVLSPPTDNYELALVDIRSMDNGAYWELRVDYTHRLIDYKIPPFKSIYYLMAVVPKSPAPIVLKPVLIQPREAGERNPDTVEVTGKLLRGINDDLHLIPLEIKRGSKESYYIRGSQAKTLLPHVGKVVTLEGRVSRESDGPYESELSVTRIVEVR